MLRTNKLGSSTFTFWLYFNFNWNTCLSFSFIVVLRPTKHTGNWTTSFYCKFQITMLDSCILLMQYLLQHEKAYTEVTNANIV